MFITVIGVSFFYSFVVEDEGAKGPFRLIMGQLGSRSAVVWRKLMWNFKQLQEDPHAGVSGSPPENIIM